MNWIDLWSLTAFASVVSDLSRAVTAQALVQSLPVAVRESDAAIYHSGRHYLFSEGR